jgi:hypothetical protein
MPGAVPDRRAWKQVSAPARDQRALPDRNAVSQLRPDLHGRADAMPRRATASGKSSLLRAPPKKHLAPECWSPRRVAPAAERCSNAVLECRVYRRFAVTSQLQHVADFIPAMCSSSGSSALVVPSALVVQSIDRNGYAPVSSRARRTPAGKHPAPNWPTINSGELSCELRAAAYVDSCAGCRHPSADRPLGLAPAGRAVEMPGPQLLTRLTPAREAPRWSTLPAPEGKAPYGERSLRMSSYQTSLDFEVNE